MIQKILNTQTKSISLASLILATAYVASAFLGLLRDRLLAGRFGAGNELDVYYTAFTIPDFVALMLIFGAVSSAIIPMFSSYYVKSKEEAWQYVQALANTFLIFLVFVCSICIIFAPLFVSLIAPGFSGEKKELTVLLMRLMFLSPIILGVSNLISGILQVFHRFLVTALASILYNLGIIVGILFFVPLFGLVGLALGVVLGGLLHVAIQLPTFFYSGFRYQRIFRARHPGVLKTIKLMVPRSLGLGAGQVNVIVITAIASTLATGSIAVFNLANNLSSLLVSAVAVSLSTAFFPTISLAYHQDRKAFERKFSGAFRQVLFLMFPVSLLVFILRAQIVRVVLGTGRFGWMDTRLTAACLGIFGLGLCAQGLIFILSKTFYAAHNTKIPALISAVTVAFNIVMSLLFVWILGQGGWFYHILVAWLKLQGIENIKVVGLALAYSVTALTEASLLLLLLYKKLRLFSVSEIANSCNRVLISSAAMALVALLTRQFLVIFNVVKLQTFLGVFAQLIVSGSAGLLVYLLIAYLLKSPELKNVKELFFKNHAQVH